MNIPLKLGVHSEAVFGGKQNEYRYLLQRVWDRKQPRCTFVMLNPSTADTNFDDPTVSKCQTFCRRWGFGSLTVVNLFALRSPSPADLRRHPDPVGGQQNDVMIAAAAAGAGLVVCAWGTNGAYLDRGQRVRELLSGYELKAFRLTKGGHPEHPLYVRFATELVPYGG